MTTKKLEKKDMDVNEHYYIFTKTEVKEQGFNCSSILQSHFRVFNNEHNSYPKMSFKLPLDCSWVALFNMCVEIKMNIKRWQEQVYKQ